MKLRQKINFSTTFLFIGLFVLINLSIYFVFSYLILEGEQEQAEAEAEKIVDGINESLGAIKTDELLRAYVPIDGMIQIVSSDHKPLSLVITPSEKELINREVQFFEKEIRQKITYKNNTYLFQSIPTIGTDGQIVNLQIMKNIQNAVNNLAILRIVLLSVTIIAMIPLVISSRLLSNVITNPITSLIETMTEIRKKGRFKRIQLESRSRDELYEMGETFNHMMDLLEANFEKQDQFVANASHELRTPLTVIESYASLMKRRGLQEPDIFHESIEAIHSEAVRMKDMVEQLLLLAKHNEEWTIQFERIDLGEHVRQTTKAFESAYRREIQFHQQQDGINAFSDQQKLKQLIYIILDNAKKYSEDVITVEVGQKEGVPFIQIADKGVGIPKEDLNKVFDRFYRVDKARSRKMGGTGLGLSLAKEIADAMNVRLTIDSVEGIGTTVKIVLPVGKEK
ncbi:sensor histidine kinase [Niallia endozanthoxylica]|uniref:histidine kinase n=1 Tax=Niallia endozanthoxylica TaxID=2036016 RepID=A0A5J5GZ20_9BACI|nr:ATP-binding protein [Niallia endozanthoxylica]KAA9012672.1 HAMP domain-containing protein [Niallia endozanthoxylica]